MNSTMNTVNSSNFEDEVVKSDRPVIVQFSTSTCLPCKKLHPVMESLASEYGDKVKVCKVDAGNEYMLASKYNIVSVPTLLYFKDGLVVNKSVGLVTKQAIVEKIEGFTKTG